jgi:predicted transcriptional regulator
MEISPQEVEVWYLLPAMRKALVQIFKQDYNLTQKKSAQLLGLTESAISQYLHSKRAQKINFTPNELLKIKKAAKDIVSDSKNRRYYFQKLAKSLRGSESLCKIHKQKDPTLPKNCELCNFN